MHTANARESAAGTTYPVHDMQRRVIRNIRCGNRARAGDASRIGPSKRLQGLGDESQEMSPVLGVMQEGLVVWQRLRTW